MRALESLTPNGSEFVNDPEACAAFVKDRLDFVIKLAKESNALRKALENIGNLTGAPTLYYGSLSGQVEELENRLQKISRTVQEAL